MAAQLKNTLAVTNLGPGASVVLPHNLNNGTRALAPDIIFLPTNELSVTASNDTSITVMNTGNLVITTSILVEAWHSIERAFGGVQNVDLPVKPVIVFGAAPGQTAPEFKPARTLFVAQSWEPGADPTVFFTTITAAIAQASALTPTLSNPVLINLYPGTYVENITIPSFVFLFGHTQVTPIINGTVDYTPTGPGGEQCNLNFLRVTGTITVDTTGKVGGSASLVIKDVVHAGNLVGVASGNNGLVSVFSSVLAFGGPFAATFTDMDVTFIGTRYGNVTFNGSCAFQLDGGQHQPFATGDITVNGTSAGEVAGLTSTLSWVLNDTSSVVFSGCTFTANSGGPANLTVAVGAFADIRSSAVADAQLIAVGAVVDRKTSISTLVSGGAGVPTAFTFATLVPAIPDYPDGNYNVHLQLGGVGDPASFVTIKTGAGFTVTDPTGASPFDVTIIRD